MDESEFMSVGEFAALFDSTEDAIRVCLMAGPALPLFYPVDEAGNESVWASRESVENWLTARGYPGEELAWPEQVIEHDA